VANGIPPDLAGEVGRYQAIDEQFVRQANGGKVPTSTADQTATTDKLNQARCVVAKALKIQVNRSSVGRTTSSTRSSRRPARWHGPPGRLAAGGTVVWLPEPGTDPPGARLLHGSADLPGAHCSGWSP
jgi:hypothetical protein